MQEKAYIRGAQLVLVFGLALFLGGCGKEELRQASYTPAVKKVEEKREEQAQPSGAEWEAFQSVVGGNTAFALALYSKLSESDDNLFFSPWSISSVFAMIAAGARGDTLSEIRKTLGFSLEEDDLHQQMGLLREYMEVLRKKRGAVQIFDANRLWIQSKLSVKEPFLAVLKKHYLVTLGRVDFGGDPRNAARIINDWVSVKTRNYIRNIFAPGMLDKRTGFIAVNAIYFKGLWQHKFDEARTEIVPFHLAPCKYVDVPIMRQKRSFRYTVQEGVQLLELPYRDGEMTMVVLLPATAYSVEELENRLTPETLQKWISALREQEVEVYLPRYKLDSAFSLKRVLNQMGVQKAFNQNRANFSGIADTRPNPLFISAVVHKATVSVDEIGTTAAAATGLKGYLGYGDLNTVFKADRPFIFLIRGKRSGSILFIGRVNNPNTHAEIQIGDCIVGERASQQL